ncbi:hypothetical protein ACFQZJ_11670 [Maribacter chungangensis]|uniref:Restriction endonuclease n=1 Tax=Maribacter chungangensis TaxID=1069117 RepID=A0ABW3B5H6_9FLAO
MSRLFVDKIRDYDGYSDHNEYTYDFLDRSSKKEFGEVRDLLNDWFSIFPESEKAEIKSRIRKDFDSTFYELFLYQLFHRLGFDILVHPKVPKSKKRPDFLVTKNDLELYVEAKVITGKSKAEESFERKRNEFYDALNKLNFDRFLISLETLIFKTDKQPNSKKFIKNIQTKIEKLNPDKISESINSGEISTLPKIEYEDEYIEAKVGIIPLIKEASSEKHKSPIGMYPMESFWGNGDNLLKKAINDKGKYYGELDKPFIVCINTIDFKTVVKSDVDNAIWGSKALSWSTNPENKDKKWIRKLDGTFLNNKGPRLKNVSGIVFTRVIPFNIKNADFVLFKHPFSTNKFDFDKLNLEYEYVKEGQILKKEGQNLSDIFNE